MKSNLWNWNEWCLWTYVYVYVYLWKYDFSDYPEDSKLFDPVNKKEIGEMKNEVKKKLMNFLD